MFKSSNIENLGRLSFENTAFSECFELRAVNQKLDNGLPFVEMQLV